MPRTPDTPGRVIEWRLLAPSDLANYLGIPEQTLANWRSTGQRGPRWYKVGRHVRYRMSDVNAWLDSEAARRSAGGRW